MPLNTELWQQPASTFDVQYAARFDQSANSYMEQTFANDGTGGGIRLAPGDFYSVDVNAVNDLHVAATVSGEDIMYTYYT